MSKLDSWLLSHKKQTGTALDVLQTFAGIGLTTLAVVVAQSFFSFYQDFLLPLIPKVSQTTPITLSGQIFVATFPLLIIITSALGVWCILETNWVTKIISKLKQKVSAFASLTVSGTEGEGK
jgi:hypothetical protein